MMLVMHVRVRMIHQFMPMDMVANFSPMQPETVQLHALSRVSQKWTPVLG